MNHSKYFAFIAIALVVASCDDPSAPPDVQNSELITHVTLRLIDSANSADTVYASFADIDGPSGSVTPSISGATLSGGRTYLASISVENRSVTPIADITEEVREENTLHQFFYAVKGQDPTAAAIQTIDTDDNGMPLGTIFKVRTEVRSAVVSDTLNVVLSHWPSPGTKNGVDRSDESDIDIDFPITIQ